MLLYSYAYLSFGSIPYLNHLAQYVNILIDSGGFTDYWQQIRELAGYPRSGPPVRLCDYIAFCKELSVWGYVALDVIRDETKTLHNLEQMVASDLTPIPVFVEGARWETIPSLVAVNPRVCVAGAVRTADDYVLQRYQLAMEYSGGEIKTHALGYGRWPEILHMPIASSDSSTWTTGAQFGRCLFFDPRDGLKSYRLADVKDKPRERLILLSLLKRGGIPLSELGIRNRWWQAGRRDPNIPLFTAANAYLSFSRHIWETVGVAYFMVMNFSSVDLHLWATMAALSDYRRYTRVLRRIGSLQGNELLAAQVEIARAFSQGQRWGRA